MSPFRFRLQRLLELRSRHEQQTAVRLAEARAEADAMRDTHDDLAATRDAGRHRMLAPQAGAGELQALGVMLEHLEGHVQAAADDLDAADEVVGGVEEDLRAASQARRVLDRLRDRRVEEWQSAATIGDRVRMDAIALTRFYHRALPAPDES